MNIYIESIKIGISVAISVYISRLLKLEFPFFVVLAIVMPIQDNFEFSFRSGRNRMIGTVIGALIGIIFFLIKPANSILSGIGAALVIYICNLLKNPQAAPIGAIVFMAMMVNIKGKNPLNYGFNRVIDTLIGVLISVSVNYLMGFIKIKNKQK